MARSQNLTIQQGRTFVAELRWEVDQIVYRPIAAITRSAPVELDVPGHGLVTGWRAVITNCQGMDEINTAEANAVLRDSDYREITVVDADTISINKINAAGFSTYTGGGILQYNAPANLNGVSVRMSIKNKEGGVELMALSGANGRISVIPLELVVRLKIDADDTALIDWKSAVYDIEAEDSDGKVTLLQYGKITVFREITT